MTCRDLDEMLTSSGAAAPPAAAQLHTATCARCRQLLGALNSDADLANLPLSPALANQITRSLVQDYTPVRPLPPAGYLIAAFAVLFAVFILLGGILLGDRALLKMNWLTAWVVFASLAVAAGSLSFALPAQMVPGSRRALSPGLLALIILSGVALVLAALFPMYREPAFWAQAWWCLRAGLVAGLLSSVSFWLILSRGAVLNMPATGALAGLLGGLTGATILELHCPDFNAAHILVGHWGAALLCAGLGWLAGELAARRG
jgi:hypothetical protein